MTPVVALVDYGAGNLTSVVKGLDAAGASVRIAATPADIDAADAIAVPGVGHFGQTASLDEAWRGRIRAALEAGRPLIGICLGMHWLFEGSEEAPGVAGLGLVSGRCLRLRGDVKVPHVGWNRLDVVRGGSRLLEGVPAPAYGYFAHSYAVPPTGDGVTAATTHGVRFASVVECGRVFGIQCHPEKSGAVGLALLRNFVSVAAECRAAASGGPPAAREAPC